MVATLSLIKVKSCHAFLRGLLVCIRSYLKSTLRYTFIILDTYQPNAKVAGSIPAGVSGFFIDIKSFRSHYGPGVDSAFNINEYQEYFLGVKAAGA